MVNSEFKKDITKFVKNSDMGAGRELNPGEMGRRYEPNSGIKKHNERIHKESAISDRQGKLPFSFSGPSKSVPRNTIVECDSCKSYHTVTKNTIGLICKDCGEYSSVTPVEV